MLILPNGFIFVKNFSRACFFLAGFLLFYEDILSHFSIFNSSGKYVTLLVFLFSFKEYIFSEQFTATGVSARLSGYMTKTRGQCGDLYPLHPYIRMHILPTVLHTFPKRLIRRICLTIKSCFSWWSSPLFSWLSCLL